MIKKLDASSAKLTLPIHGWEQNGGLLHLEIYEIKPDTTFALPIAFLTVQTDR